MKKNIYYTPGPSAIYPTVERHLQKAFDEYIPSISHRSEKFRSIYQSTYENLRELLNIPKDFAILFTGSATEIWEKIILNCVDNQSSHFVNGAFSRKFFETAQILQKEPQAIIVQTGEGFENEDLKQVSEKTELIAFTHNETSTGVSMPLADMYAVCDNLPNKIYALDMVSSAPYPKIDFQKIDTAFFSVQKSFGLPAGLGVWIVNEKCFKKAQRLEEAGKNTGYYHRLTQMWKFFEKFETQATPNITGIYLLGEVIKDFLKIGIEKLRKETDEKATFLYDFLDKHESLKAFVKNPLHRSKTVIVAECKDNSAKNILEKLKTKGFIVGSGYGNFKEKHLRIANFLATSPEEIQLLTQALNP